MPSQSSRLRGHNVRGGSSAACKVMRVSRAAALTMKGACGRGGASSRHRWKSRQPLGCLREATAFRFFHFEVGCVYDWMDRKTVDSL